MTQGESSRLFSIVITALFYGHCALFIVIASEARQSGRGMRLRSLFRVKRGISLRDCFVATAPRNDMRGVPGKDRIAVRLAMTGGWSVIMSPC